MPEAMCIAAVKELQNSAIDKLRAREKFNSTGLASLKVKIPSAVGSGSDMINLEIRLAETGRDLRNLLAGRTATDPNHIKIIAKGRVLEDGKSLGEQGIANDQQLIALVVSIEAVHQANIYDCVAKIRNDAKLLTDKSYFSLENQDGSKVYLPKEERERLMMGLALYEKGRAAMQRENYTEALVLFLEADEEFCAGESRLFASVDNYALLNLDIVWCYFCLKSITQLPDAERRLNLCEENFKKSYGQNLDRVASIRGKQDNERALILRLHLLKAILYYHMTRRAEAQHFLALADTELGTLKVDEVALVSLVEMGYSLQEARFGLRAVGGNNVELAVNELMLRREKKADARKQAKEERRLLGKFENVNPHLLKQLVEMGFVKEMVAMALEKCDNNLERAVVMLQENSDELQCALADRNSLDAVSDLLKQVGLNFYY